MTDLNRAFARAKARELTPEELREVYGGDGGDGGTSYCAGTSIPSGDVVSVADDTTVNPPE